MSNWDEATMADIQEVGDEQPMDGGENRRHTPALTGSPYPRKSLGPNSVGTVTCLSMASSSAVQVLTEHSSKHQTLGPQVTSSRGTIVKPSGPSQRATSIRWAENLPIPDRKLSPLPVEDSFHTNTAPQGAPVPYNDYQLYGEPYPEPPEYLDYIAEQRNYEAEQREKIIQAKQEQDLNTNKLQSPRVTSDNMAYASSSRPSQTLGRPMAPIIRATLNEESQVKKSLHAGYDGESSVASSRGDIALRLPPHEAHRASTGRPNRLTDRALKDLHAIHGVGESSKKSHSSWDISVEENGAAGNGDGSSRFSVPSAPDRPSPGNVHPWLASWFKTLPPETAIFSFKGGEDYSRRGIDPETGRLMDFIEQPDTWVDNEHEQKMRPYMIQRRNEWTSNFIIRREINIRENMMRRRQEAKQQEHRRSVVKQIQNQAVAPSEAAPRSETKAAAQAKKTIVSAPTVLKNQTVTDCTLRPGLLSDAKGCADIYNMAVSVHAPLPDTKPVTVQQFESIVNDCSREKLPFVVATVQRADLTDAKSWPSFDAYRQYMKWKQSQPNVEMPPEKVIYGFAFLSPYEKGLASETGASTETVKATVFVHPEHRRHGVGSALICQLLRQTSILFYGSDVQYEWNGPAASQNSFQQPSFRQIHRIVIHGVVDRECKELAWMDRFLKSFQFDKAGRLDQVYKVVKPHSVDWYDQVIWVHWANKVSPSQSYYMGDESECSYDYPGKSCSPGNRRGKSANDEDPYPHGLGYADREEFFQK